MACPVRRAPEQKRNVGCGGASPAVSSSRCSPAPSFTVEGVPADWLFVVFEMCASKNGVAAREIERKYDLYPKTAWFMVHRIREAMRRDPLVGLLKGTVVADETYIGGKPGQHAPEHPAPKSTWETDKTPVRLAASTPRPARFVAGSMPQRERRDAGRRSIRGKSTSPTPNSTPMAAWATIAVGSSMAAHETVNHECGRVREWQRSHHQPRRGLLLAVEAVASTAPTTASARSTCPATSLSSITATARARSPMPTACGR